ncbi:MAG: GTP-binding protein [Chloroflexota bacterium]
MAESQRHILIVDNDTRIVEEIVRGLSDQTTFQIHAFTNGTDACAALQRITFDLIIADWKMADVDGLTLIREAKAKSLETVTVLMSAYELTEAKSLSKESTAHHYLTKPFTMEELLSVVNSILPPAPLIGAVGDAPLVLKVILGGDANVGKTSLIERYCTCEFDPEREMTIGVDFHLYDARVEQMPLRLIVWDLGGQERFSFARRAFYRGTQAIGLIFDVSNRTSFYNLMRWWREAREFAPDIPILLLANKTDLPRQVPRDEAQQIAHAWNTPFFESSCASGEGINEFFEALAFHAWQHAQQKNAGAG